MAALAAGGIARVTTSPPALGAEQLLPPNAIETVDGAFFPIDGGLSGFYVRDDPAGPKFWSLYDAAGGHAWYGPPISRVWSDATNWYQLFACAMFLQPRAGGAPRLAPIVDRIVYGPRVSPSFSNATKLEFDGWPQYSRVTAVDPTIAAFITAHPALQVGDARSRPRSFAGKVRNLFANLGLENVGGNVRLGVLGQRYRAYFQGKPTRLPSAAVAPEEFALSDEAFGISDDLPGTDKGIDRGFGCTLASEQGVAAGIDHMNRLGLWWGPRAVHLEQHGRVQRRGAAHDRHRSQLPCLQGDHRAASVHTGVCGRRGFRAREVQPAPRARLAGRRFGEPLWPVRPRRGREPSATRRRLRRVGVRSESDLALDPGKRAGYLSPADAGLCLGRNPAQALGGPHRRLGSGGRGRDRRRRARAPALPPGASGLRRHDRRRPRGAPDLSIAQRRRSKL